MIIKLRRQSGQTLGVGAHVAVGVFVGEHLGGLALAGEILLRPDEWQQLSGGATTKLLIEDVAMDDPYARLVVDGTDVDERLYLTDPIYHGIVKRIQQGDNPRKRAEPP